MGGKGVDGDEGEWDGGGWGADGIPSKSFETCEKHRYPSNYQKALKIIQTHLNIYFYQTIPKSFKQLRKP